MEQDKIPSKRRSFYVEDALWFKFQSKLRGEGINASKWIREMIDWYLEEPIMQAPDKE
jgi:hypothetical protein